jgi:hypothetical protein
VVVNQLEISESSVGGTELLQTKRFSAQREGQSLLIALAGQGIIKDELTCKTKCNYMVQF